jgi:hypothetical protein
MTRLSPDAVSPPCCAKPTGADWSPSSASAPRDFYDTLNFRQVADWRRKLQAG